LEKEFKIELFFSLRMNTVVKYLLNIGTNTQLVQLLIGCSRINSVRQKYIHQFILWISPRACACETLMTKSRTRSTFACRACFTFIGNRFIEYQSSSDSGQRC